MTQVSVVGAQGAASLAYDRRGALAEKRRRNDEWGGGSEEEDGGRRSGAVLKQDGAFSQTCACLAVRATNL